MHGLGVDVSLERVGVTPRSQVSGWDDIDVCVQHQRRPAAVTRKLSHRAPGLEAIDLDAGEVRLAEHLGERDLPVVYV